MSVSCSRSALSKAANAVAYREAGLFSVFSPCPAAFRKPVRAPVQAMRVESIDSLKAKLAHEWGFSNLILEDHGAGNTGQIRHSSEMI